ncbi:MAG: mechanosensitive ion channel [Pseudomonadales bacterium]|nr:mechanosensitive ion channel [Pseudomonadales bacterium]
MLDKLSLNWMMLFFPLLFGATAWTAAHANAEIASVDPNSPILVTLSQIRTLREELQALDELANKAQGEELQSLNLQRFGKTDELLYELQELSMYIHAAQNDGMNLQALLAPYQEELLNAGSSLRSDIRTYQRNLDSLRKNNDTLTSEGLNAYKIHSAELDSGFAILDEYIEVVEAIDKKANPSRSFIVQTLPQRMQSLASEVNLTVAKQDELKRALSLNNTDVDLQLKTTLLKDKLAFDTDSLRQLMIIANRYTIDVSNYHSLLVKSTGELSADLLNAEVIGVLVEDWWFNAKHDVRNNVANFIFKLIVFVLIIAAFKILSSLVARIIRKSVESHRMHISILMQEMIISLVSRLILLLGVLFALAQLGISLGPVLAGLGVAGFVIGFALQDVLGNFASGMMILFYRPYDVGDIIEAGGAFGTVQSMSLVSTTILTFDNQTLIIPNGKIWGDVIKNVTAQRVRRVDMVFGISYDDSIEHAEKILNDIVLNHPKVLEDPVPTIKLHTLGESSVDFVVRPWTLTADYWTVYWDITREVKLRFDAEGLTIPFPQRDVHIAPYQNESV